MHTVGTINRGLDDQCEIFRREIAVAAELSRSRQGRQAMAEWRAKSNGAGRAHVREQARPHLGWQEAIPPAGLKSIIAV